jgi:hypothetical protein
MDQPQPPAGPPPMSPPPAQPQWTPPPQQPVGWGGPGYSGPPMRPTGVTLAAIYLIVMGILLALVGACTTLVGGGVADLENQAGSGTVFGGAFAIFGLIILVVAIAGIVGGVGAMNRSGWGRWVSIVVSVIMVIVFALLTIAFLGGRATGIGFGVAVVAILYALCAWAMISAGGYFSYRR